MRIAVITNDNFLYQKIKLSTIGISEVMRADSISDAAGCDICLEDVRGASDSRAISNMRRDYGELTSEYANRLGGDGGKRNQHNSRFDSDDLYADGSTQNQYGAHFDSNYLDGDGGANSSYKLPEGVVHFTMGDGGDLPVPFSFDALLSLIEGKAEVKAELTLGDRCAYLRGERIHLTEVELALLKVLYDANGEFVSREELLSLVWGEGADAGVVNVYVYYLRQKLERGEKIINTSRKLGYKIDKKYLGWRADECSE